VLPLFDDKHTGTAVLSVQRDLVQINVVLCFQAVEDGVCFADQRRSGLSLRQNRDVSGAEKSSRLLLDELNDLSVGDTNGDKIRDSFGNRIWEVVRGRGKERVIMEESVFDLHIKTLTSLENLETDLTSGFGSFGAFAVICSMTVHADAVGRDRIARCECETVTLCVCPEVIDSFGSGVKRKVAEVIEFQPRESKRRFVHSRRIHVQ
jgi:hypothetical protein